MKTLDLFSGIGGFSLGLERAGFETVAFCEIDKYCQKVIKKFWDKKIYNDVKEITKQKLKSDGIEFPEIITGGFPCQPFSIAGARKGTDDNRHLWPEMFRIIKEFKPRWVIGENVRGIINIQDGMVFENVCTDLEGEGYEVRAFNIPAAGVGAPHKRERIWIVANSRRTLRQGSELGRTNANESEQENAYQYQRSSGTPEHNVANSKSIESYVGKHRKHQTEGNGQSETRGESGEDVANADSERQQKQWGSESIQEKVSRQTTRTRFECESGWSVEPDVGRVAHGLSGRVHRLKALGNSIVPKIAEEIGRAIAIAERKL